MVGVRMVCHKCCCAKYTIRIYIFYNTNMANHKAAIADLFGSENEDSDSSDDPPPALVEDEEIYPVHTYGTQTVIALQVKRSSYTTYVEQHQWAFVELELIPSHLEWGPVLEQLDISWVASAAQELSSSRQLMHGESMNDDVSRGPYTQSTSANSVCTVVLPMHGVP